MILYLALGLDVPTIDASVWETRQLTLDLIGSDMSTIDFDPGFFDNAENPITQALWSGNLHGKPAYTNCTHMIGRFQVHLATNVGRDFGTHVYLYYSPTDDRQLYRARVYQIQFQPEESAAYFNVPDRNMKATLIIIHGVWQGDLTQLPLTNSYNTNTLSALQIDNTKDATYDNTVLINGEDVLGDLPAPIKIKLINTSAPHISQYWIGLNVHSAPNTFNHIAEGEAALPLDNVASADASNGNSNKITVVGTTEAEFLTWTLDITRMIEAAGNQFHILIRNHYNLDSNIYFRFTIEDGGGNAAIWRGEQVSFPDAGANLYIGDYGVVRLPPWRVDRAGYPPASIRLILNCAQIIATAGSVMHIDCLHFFPVDGFRNIKFRYWMDQNDTLIDDMTENVLYQTLTGGGRNSGTVTALGGPLLIHPGRDQKLYFLVNNNAGDTAEVTNTVQIWYRPQRLVI